MKTSRRQFAGMVGAVIAAPAAAVATELSIWERAEAELQETGEISPEVVRTLLDMQGPRGIYDDPKEFESLRSALARAIPEHKSIRQLSVSMDIEPLLNFKR
jgi:hypothetical protein